jgi:hypothetical protein
MAHIVLHDAQIERVTTDDDASLNGEQMTCLITHHNANEYACARDVIEILRDVGVGAKAVLHRGTAHESP